MVSPSYWSEIENYISLVPNVPSVEIIRAFEWRWRGGYQEDYSMERNVMAGFDLWSGINRIIGFLISNCSHEVITLWTFRLYGKYCINYWS